MIINKPNKARSSELESFFKELDGYNFSNSDVEFLTYNLRGEFNVYKKHQVKNELNFYRLTFPLFLLYCLVMLLVICPIKWAITGNFKLQYNENRFHTKWYNKIFRR